MNKALSNSYLYMPTLKMLLMRIRTGNDGMQSMIHMVRKRLSKSLGPEKGSRHTVYFVVSELERVIQVYYNQRGIERLFVDDDFRQPSA